MNPAFLPKRGNFAYRNVKVRRQFDKGVSWPAAGARLLPVAMALNFPQAANPGQLALPDAGHKLAAESASASVSKGRPARAG
ncbi:MAG: hypothetical protein ABSG80_07675 [Verrucomicrobiota bacterium]|jgi:hypothetical protein